MGELIPFPIQIRPTDYWCFYDPWAQDGYWMNCCSCKRRECFCAGHYFVACTHHTDNKKESED
ncbi:MAG: hypothetical protein K6C12_00860 [Oscillospiraceae bacterium]|nr:hypothetical protein [Oscillospiraceae bacterium]